MVKRRELLCSLSLSTYEPSAAAQVDVMGDSKCGKDKEAIRTWAEQGIYHSPYPFGPQGSIAAFRVRMGSEI
jgi:hypothetical protein